MKKIFMKSIDKLIIFEESIYNISIENISLYKNLIFNFSDNAILSDNDKEVDEKYLIIIKEPFSLNVNDSKLIKGLYKKLTYLLDDSILQDINKIQIETFDIIDRLSIKIDANIEYDDIDFTKLLSSISLRFEEPQLDNYLELLISYIKIYVDLLSIKFVVSFRLLEFLKKEEIDELKFKLNSLGVVLLNIDFNINNTKANLTVDNDYCII